MSTATTHIDNKLALQASHCANEGRSKRKQSHPLVPALRFREFEEKWVNKNFGDVLKITSAARVHKEEWSETGVPFFRSSDVVANFKGKENSKAYIPFELYESLSKKIGRVKKDDLLVTGGGSIGIPYLIKNSDPLYFKDADLLWLKNTKETSGYFLYSFLITQLFRKYLKSTSHIGTIAHYTVVQAKNTPCKFPSLPEQQKIAFFLSAVDEKIQQLTKKKELLEAYKKGVMQQLFSGQLRFKDENGNPYPDWEEKRLGEVFGVIRGKGISKDQLNDNGETKCILYGQLYTTYNEVVFNVVSRTDTNEGVLSIKGDLLVPSSTTTTGIDLANVTALNEEGVLLGGDISILRSKLDANNVFYAYYLSNHKKYEIAAFAQGSTIVHLSYNHFKVMRIDIPVIEEQQKIARYLSRIDTKIESVNNQITQTQTFKKGLLQQMFV
jgi:type I restriction enzyme S subunit